MRTTLQSLRGGEGFTLIELAVVLAIIGVMVAFAVPSLVRYQRREEVRERAQIVAGLMREARARASREGTPHLVVFGDPADPANTIGKIVRDRDLTFNQTLLDDEQIVNMPVAPDARIGLYGVMPTTPFNGQALPAMDPTGGNLSGVADGFTLPLLAAVGPNTHGVVFDTNGIALSPAPQASPGNPGAAGSGAGGVYITDQDVLVYAVLVGPLGEVRVRRFNPTGVWE